MNSSKLSYDQIQTLAEQLHVSASSMESLLNEIKVLFERIGSDDIWSGAAAANAKETFDTLSAKFPEFSQAVDACYRYLISVVESYKNIDATVARQLQ